MKSDCQTLWFAGPRQSGGASGRVRRDEFEEDRVGNKHRHLLKEARPRGEAHQWIGRGEREVRKKAHQFLLVAANSPISG